MIGVITSERGAVIQDIRTTIARRFPRPVLLWPVPVQGEGAAERIAAAIAGFERVVPRPDVLIVARGGGSLEDLMAFNEEVVVRAVAACRIPLISAVGHETDTTLIDFASDRRAPTPTAAAELAVPARADLVADLEHKAARLIGGLNRLAQECRLRLSRAERGLPDLPALLGGGARSGWTTGRNGWCSRCPTCCTSGAPHCDTVRSGGCPTCRAMLTALRERVQERGVRLIIALPNFVARRHATLDLCGQKLAGMPAARRGQHPQPCRTHARSAVGCAAARQVARDACPAGGGRGTAGISVAARGAARGYALVSDSAGHPLTSASQGGAWRPAAGCASPTAR